jgi:predicted peptidase
MISFISVRRLAAVLLPLTVAGCRDVRGADVRSSATASAGPGFVVRAVADSGTTYHYQVFVPQGAEGERGRRWPVILFLHGAGQMGTDGVQQTRDGLGTVVRAQGTSFPAIVVFPQSPRGERGVGRAIFARIAMRALDQTMAEFGTDSTRVYLVGYSMGAKVGYELVAQHPDRFAAFVPVAGDVCVPCVTDRPGAPPGAPPGDALVDSVYRNVIRQTGAVPMWIFHGRVDPTVAVAGAHRIVELRRSMGAPTRYTEYPQGNHLVWADAFATPGLFPWLFAQRRSLSPTTAPSPRAPARDR